MEKLCNKIVLHMHMWCNPLLKIKGVYTFEGCGFYFIFYVTLSFIGVFNI